MKTILCLSDTHGNKKGIDSIATQLSEADYVFHLGDVMSDAKYIKDNYNKNIFFIHGNCDNGDSEEIIEIEGVKFLLCHGHKYSVKSNLTKLHLAGIEKAVDVCCFGHTHEEIIEKFHNITLLNPGTMSGVFSMGTYCYITVFNGKFAGKIVNL